MSSQDLARQDPADPLAVPLPALPTDEEFHGYVRLAKNLAAAGIYKDIRQASQAFAKLIIGRDLGLNVSQSMQGVQFVQGQIQLHYSILAMVIKARGFSWQTIERSTTRAAAKFFDPEGNELDEVEFTMEDATRAGLLKKSRSGEAGMYEKYPRNMLWARMMSDAVRFVIPEATGGVPVYVPGEIVPTQELTEGEGTGEPRGEPLPPEVEEIIARAARLGHAGWADRSVWEYRRDAGEEVLRDTIVQARDDLERKREEVEAGITEAVTDADVITDDIPADAEDLPEPPSRAAERPAGGSEDAPEGEATLEDWVQGRTAETSPEEPSDALPEDEAPEVAAETEDEEDLGGGFPQPTDVPHLGEPVDPSAIEPAAQDLGEEPPSVVPVEEFDAQVTVQRLKRVLAMKAPTEAREALKNEEVEYLCNELKEKGGFTPDQLRAIFAEVDPGQGTLM